MIGKTVSHYRIQAKIAEGGMGVVYRAEDLKLRRPVALKFLRQNLVSEGQKRRFQREAQAAAALDHPNICTVYDIGEWEEQSFIVMAYVEGQSLEDRIAEAAINCHEALDWITQIGAGLREAHANGIVHRDIKSANIMITAKGQAKIMDFGLARLLDESRVTQQGTKMGTVGYMSPEQALGRNVDHRSDIWSLGVLLYEMLTGRLPFYRERDQAVIYAILNEDPPSIQERNPNVPAEVEAVLRKALNKDPEGRYQQVADFLRDIRRGQKESVLDSVRHRFHGSGDDVSQEQVAASGSFHKQRSSWRFVGISVMAGLLAATITWMFWRDNLVSPEAINPTAIAVLPFSVRGSEEYAYLREGMVDLLGSKFDGVGGLRSVDSRALLGHLAKERNGATDFREVALRFQAHYYITGSILEAGGQFQIDASLYATDRQPVLAQASVNGGIAQLFDMVDDVAAQLLANLNIETGSRLKRIALMTTNSLPALKAYLEGESAFRAGQYEQALEAFRRAVTEDSSFALAYYRLSVAADWLTRPQLSQQAAERAVRHSARLSEHDRLLLNALLAWRSGEAEKAERLYRAIVGTYLDDVEAWFQLGEVLFHYGPVAGRSISEARDEFEAVLGIESDHVPSLWHLVRIAAIENRGAEVTQLVDRIRNLQPEGERLLEILTLQAFAVDDQEAQQRMLTQLQWADDLTLILATWNVACYTDDFRKAIPLAELFTRSNRSSEVKTLGHLMLAHLYLAAGQRKESEKALEAAGVLDSFLATEHAALLNLAPFLNLPESELLDSYNRVRALRLTDVSEYVTPNIFFTVHNHLHPYLKSFLSGSLAARLGLQQEAQKAATRLLANSGDREYVMLANDFGLSIQAELAMGSNNFEKASQLLTQLHPHTWYGLMAASPFYSRAHQRYVHAEVLRSLGEKNEVLRFYRSFGQYSVYDLIYLAPGHYHLGQIYEQRGEFEKAAEHYRGFVNFWRDCDEEFRPRVDAARVRIEELAQRLAVKPQ